MGFGKGLLGFLGAAGKQVSTSTNLWKYEPDKREIHISNNCLKRLKDLGLGEDSAYDVYYRGTMSENGKMVKKYNGYELGIFFMITPDTGKVIITYIWKRERR